VGIVGGVIGLGVGRLVVGLGGGVRAIRFCGRLVRRLGVRLARVFLVVLLVGLLLVLLFRHGLAHGDAVVEAEHDDDGVRLLGCENSLGRGGPIRRIAFGLVFDQAGNRLVLAEQAHVEALDVGILSAGADPVGHAVAEHQH